MEAFGDTPDEINATVSAGWNGPNEIVIRAVGVPKRAETAVGDVQIFYR